MKRKHKIVIAAGVISLSMITAMATGLINTGNLFAEDPTVLKSGSLTSVNGDFLAFPTDKLIGFGGDTFLYQNNDIFLRSANTGEGPYAPSAAADAKEAMDYNKSLAKQEAVTYGANLYNSLNTFEKAYIIGDGNSNYAFIPELSQMTNTRITDGHMWTCTPGDKDGRIKFIEGINQNPEMSRPDVEITAKNECVKLEDSTKIVADAFGKVVYVEEKSVTSDKIPASCSMEYEYSYKIGGGTFFETKTEMVSDCTNPPQINQALSAEDIKNLTGSVIAGFKSATVKSVTMINPGYPAITCSVTYEVESAGYRPAIQLQNLDVSMLMDNASNSPITEASSEVKMAFKSNDLSLTVIENSIPLDKDGNLKVGVGDNIKVAYTSSNSTGEASNIIAVYKDETGKKVGYKNIGTAGVGDLNIPTNSLDEGQLGLGNYTVELYNMVLNGTSVSNLTSAGQAISFETYYNLKDSEVTLTANKVAGTTDWYDGDGIKFNATIAAPYADLANYIRVGTADKIETAEWKATNTVFAEDGVYEKVQEVNADGSLKVDDEGNPVYNYDDCLYVQVADSTDPATQRVSSKLRLDSIKIDSKKPYFPSGKNGEEAPITIENIKDPDPAPTSFFASVFSLGDTPGEDLEEEFGSKHIKLIPNAKDYAASDYNDDGTLKSTAKALEGGIVSYKLDAKYLDGNGSVDNSRTFTQMTINVHDAKYKDIAPYFELQGTDSEAYWIELTAVDRAGREETL